MPYVHMMNLYILISTVYTDPKLCIITQVFLEMSENKNTLRFCFKIERLYSFCHKTYHKLHVFPFYRPAYINLFL